MNLKTPDINSLAIDICATMRFLWKELREYKRFKKTIIIFCDSHDLQLLIKDIFK
jgi:hypothetical protein